MTDFFQRVRQSGGLSSFFWEVTRRCNQRCPFCYLPASATGDELPLSLLSRLISELRDLHCLTVILSGGEPFLREDLLDLVGGFRRHGLAVIIFTNGSLVKPHQLQDMVRLGVSRLEVTVFSTNPQTAAAMGCPEVGRVMATVEQATALRLPVTIKTPVTKRNLGDLPALDEWCRSLGLMHQLDPLIQSPEDHRQLAGDRVDAHDAATLLGDVTCRCELGPETLAMRWDGTLIPCLTIPRPIGCWPRQSLRDVLSSSTARETWHELNALAANCRTCAHYDRCPRCPGLFLSEADGKPWSYLCDFVSSRASVL